MKLTSTAIKRIIAYLKSKDWNAQEIIDFIDYIVNK